MELKQITYFLEVARLEHMSQAAEFLNIAQPTLSRSISALEKSLGTPLFDRVGNRLRLNTSGQRFYACAKQALQMLDTGALAAKQSGIQVAGNLSIVCMSFAPILIPCVSEYMELNPLVNIEILQYSHDMEHVSGADCDFILSSANDEMLSGGNTRIWVPQSLFKEDVYFVIGPNHPRFPDLPPEGERLDLSQFSGERYVTMRLAPGMIDFTYSICRNAGFFPRSSIQTDDFVVKMTLVRNGIGVAFLPECCLDEAERLCPGVRALQVSHCNIRRTILLLRRKKNLLSEAALDFWEFVLGYYHLPRDTRN